MQDAQYHALLFVMGLGIAGIGFIGVVFLLNTVLSPRNPNYSKGQPYECGMEPAGRPWSIQDLRFSTVAMLFVLFDAETVLLFAVSTKLRGNPVALMEVAVFVTCLALGLGYAWRKGSLEWRS